MANILISIKNLRYSLGSNLILENINLDVYQGDYLGIIGPNGGGKTTLIKLILGLIPKQQGELKLFNQKIESFHDWYKIGYVPQRSTQVDSRFPATVYEIVSLGRVGKKGLFNKYTTDDYKAIDQALEIAQIGKYKDKLISQLSGGLQQRVLIAKALAAKPDLLILDEPTVGVDIESQDKFYDFLAKLNKENGLTLILISHDIDIVVNEANKVACLNRSLLCDLESKELLKSDYLTKLYGQPRKILLHDH